MDWAIYQPLDDIRAMCAEIDRREAEEKLYQRWTLYEQAMTAITPWLKKKPKLLNFGEYKQGAKKAVRSGQKPDRAAFYAAYGSRIKRPEGGK